MLYSQHQVIPFNINSTSGSIGTVKISSKSYFLIRGNSNPAQTINYSFINNQTKNGASKTSTTGGATWTNQTFTVDSHLHQFDNLTIFYHYVCANDTLNQQTCSTPIPDLMELAGIPPNIIITYPTENLYSGFINITYSYFSANSYAMSYSNISLFNTSLIFNLTINSNNSINLSYNWNSSLARDGQYIIQVCVKDSQNQPSCAYSENITINNSANSCTISTTSNTFINTVCIYTSQKIITNYNISIGSSGKIIMVNSNITANKWFRPVGTTGIIRDTNSRRYWSKN